MLSIEVVRHPPLPCRASPPQGGRSGAALRPLHRLSGNGGDGAGVAIRHVSPISPLEGEMPGRAEGGLPTTTPMGEETR
ncbi:MAG: hypothetical protein CTR54_20815 [Rhizobium sp.]|nr:MAG: hypothetical protein CTR54_20815 [Rhizobium sp.]